MPSKQPTDDKKQYQDFFVTRIPDGNEAANDDEKQQD
jgi:hypothetical protein